jgi:DNA-binding LacI/PurR family transcriptional regulator
MISAQVGRGTYFVGEGAAAADPAGPGGVAAAAARVQAVRSVLLLRRSISITRGRVLVEGLQRRFTADGHRVLEVSYTDPEHARSVLKGLPRFDACVVQSSFKTITIELLAALREKSDVLAVDGAALVGTDVDAVGMEWGEPLAAAVALLRQHGHRRIAYATTSRPFLATQLGWRRFETLQHTLPGIELTAITVPQLPDENYEAALVELLRGRAGAGGALPFTALAAWGIEDGAKLRTLLADAGIDVPGALSIVLLGRTDLANEHADFYDTVGCSVADQIEQLHAAVEARWAEPSRPYGVRLIPLAACPGRSVAAPRPDAAPMPPSAEPRARRSRP